MKQSERIVLELVRSGLWGRKADERLFAGTTAEEWSEALRLSGRQGVLAIAYDGLNALPRDAQPPKELLLRWAVNVDRIERDFDKRADTARRLAEFFAARGIPMMQLKGAGLASLYPVPCHRPCGDIDIWLFGHQREADEALRRDLGIEVSDDMHHHTICSVDGVLVENHFDFLNCWSHRSNREVERELRRFAEEPCGELQAGDTTILLPSPNLNALFLMRHMAIHFAAVEIGLRHMVDWAVFLAHHGREVDWEQISRIFREQNMERFADAATGIAVDVLGMDPAAAPLLRRDPELEEQVLRETLTPAFSEKKQHTDIWRSTSFKIRRWWANRWKHRLVYRDSLADSFLWLCWAHIIKPKTITR